MSKIVEAIRQLNAAYQEEINKEIEAICALQPTRTPQDVIEAANAKVDGEGGLAELLHVLCAMRIGLQRNG